MTCLKINHGFTLPNNIKLLKFNYKQQYYIACQYSHYVTFKTMYASEYFVIHWAYTYIWYILIFQGRTSPFINRRSPVWVMERPTRALTAGGGKSWHLSASSHDCTMTGHGGGWTLGRSTPSPEWRCTPMIHVVVCNIKTFLVKSFISSQFCRICDI